VDASVGVLAGLVALMSVHALVTALVRLNGSYSAAR
jgi:hypothetical protein